MKRFYSTLVLIGFISCAPVRVDYDFMKGTDFSQYKTYNFYGQLQTGMSELDDKRIVNAINANLQSKGFVQSDNPDFYIDIKTESWQDVNQGNRVGVGVGGSGRNVGGGISVGIPVGQTKFNRRIIIEFRDENGKGLFWQAVSDSNYDPNATPEKREMDFKVIVDKIFSEYPPNNN